MYVESVKYELSLGSHLRSLLFSTPVQPEFVKIINLHQNSITLKQMITQRGEGPSLVLFVVLAIILMLHVLVKQGSTKYTMLTYPLHYRCRLSKSKLV